VPKPQGSTTPALPQDDPAPAPTSTSTSIETTDLPGFVPPPEPTPDPPELVEVTTAEPTHDDAREPPYTDDLDGLDDLSSTIGPSQVSTADPATFASLIGLGLGMAGLALHARLAPGENPCWLVDEQDQAAIAGPLARIMARRVKVTAGAAGDVADGIELFVGGAGYVVKNLNAQAAMVTAPTPWTQSEQHDS